MTPRVFWQHECNRLFALWELALINHGAVFAELFERDAYRALQYWMSLRP